VSSVVGSQKIAISAPLYSNVKSPCCSSAASFLIPEKIKLEEEKLASSSNTSVKPNSSNIFGNGVALTIGPDIDVGIAVNVGTAVEAGTGELVGSRVTVAVGVGV